MDREFLNACSQGDLILCNEMIKAKPDILLSTTPHKNNCLHIASMLGLVEIAMAVWSRAPSLFSDTNVNGETPLIAALMAANRSLASDIITAATQYMQHDDLEEGSPLNCMLLMADTHGQNALHHAIRNGFEDFAVDLLNIEPRLSEQLIRTNESAMYMAARRGYSDVVARLLEIPSSAVCGPDDETAMHAAVRFNHKGIVRQLLNGRPQLASCACNIERNGIIPLHGAVHDNNMEVVNMFLEHDPNLAYIKNGGTENTPFIMAVQQGYVSVAEEIRKTCPDSVYTPNKEGNSALHEAIKCEQQDSVDYILRTPQLHRFINQATNDGSLPLHTAAEMVDPMLLRSLLAHSGLDSTAVNVHGKNAVSKVYSKTALWKTLKWNESFTLLSNVIPSGWKHAITDKVNQANKKQAIKNVKPLTAKYTSNTSLVAALLATITFAAAFALPGGFSTNSTNDDAGQPVFASKFSFKVFLISDTIAMCSSLAVAFLCILATWEDLDFLLNYRKKTKALMWCAYWATSVAFGTGLFAEIAPKNLWLAIIILVLCIILPILSKFVGEWPLIMVKYRLGSLFRKDLIPYI